MKSLDELLSRESAWPRVLEWIRDARTHVELLAAADPGRSEALVQLQVTTRSPMGAIVYECGGLLLDGGWLRILGSGHPRLPRSLPAWNFETTWPDPTSPPTLLLVADDVVGGYFAVDGGALGSKPGNVNYFAPDRLEWEDMEWTYTDFLDAMLTGDLEKFYEGMRWPGWREEIAKIGGDEALMVYPPLFADGPEIAERHRGVVPVHELFGFQFDMRRQMADAAEDEDDAAST